MRRRSTPSFRKTIKPDFTDGYRHPVTSVTAIGDFVDAFPQAPLEASGQINAYDVSVSGLNEGEWVNIDIYGYILNKKGYVKSRFAPFSHNAPHSSWRRSTRRRVQRSRPPVPT